MNAQELFDWLTDMKADGVNLSKVDVLYRYDYDSDVERIRAIDEDLFDGITNNELTSIVLITDPIEK